MVRSNVTGRIATSASAGGTGSTGAAPAARPAERASRPGRPAAPDDCRRCRPRRGGRAAPCAFDPASWSEAVSRVEAQQVERPGVQVERLGVRPHLAGGDVDGHDLVAEIAEAVLHQRSGEGALALAAHAQHHDHPAVTLDRARMEQERSGAAVDGELVEVVEGVHRGRAGSGDRATTRPSTHQPVAASRSARALARRSRRDTTDIVWRAPRRLDRPGKVPRSSSRGLTDLGIVGPHPHRGRGHDPDRSALPRPGNAVRRRSMVGAQRSGSSGGPAAGARGAGLLRRLVSGQRSRGTCASSRSTVARTSAATSASSMPVSPTSCPMICANRPLAVERGEDQRGAGVEQHATARGPVEHHQVAVDDGEQRVRRRHHDVGRRGGATRDRLHRCGAADLVEAAEARRRRSCARGCPWRRADGGPPSEHSADATRHSGGA